MTGPVIYDISKRVRLTAIRDERFKTIRISIHFMMPLDKDNVSKNALIPFLLSRSTKDYPDFTKLSKRLAELYGASVSSDVSKIGDVQVLTVSAVCIADQYCFGGEKLSYEVSDLIMKMVLDPLFDEEGCFKEEDFNQEKRQTIENIESEFNDKKIYAKHRLEQIMCADEPFGIGRYGSKSSLESVERKELGKIWKKIISEAKTEVMVLGNFPQGLIEDKLIHDLKILVPDSSFDYSSVIKPYSENIKRETETISAAQSKLVMGFRTGTYPDTEEEMQTRVMISLLGGSPHSKLFLNVREKMSLCYYCSSQYQASKGIMYIQSGVETSNLKAAEDAIIEQIQQIQRGDFTDDDVKFTKLSLINSYQTIEDYLGGTEGWYLSQVFRKKRITPMEAVQLVKKVNRQQIIDAANRLTLDTVFRLVGKGDAS